MASGSCPFPPQLLPLLLRFLPCACLGSRYFIGSTQDCDQASLALQPCSRSFDSLSHHRPLRWSGWDPRSRCSVSDHFAASLHTEPRQPFPRFRHVGQQLPIWPGARPPSRSHSTRPPSACPRAARRYGRARAWRARTTACRRRSIASAPAMRRRADPHREPPGVAPASGSGGSSSRRSRPPGRACPGSRSASGSPPRNRPAPDRGTRRSSRRAAEPGEPRAGRWVPAPRGPPGRRSVPGPPCRRATATRAAPSSDGAVKKPPRQRLARGHDRRSRGPASPERSRADRDPPGGRGSQLNGEAEGWRSKRSFTAKASRRWPRNASACPRYRGHMTESTTHGTPPPAPRPGSPRRRSSRIAVSAVSGQEASCCDSDAPDGVDRGRVEHPLRFGPAVATRSPATAPPGAISGLCGEVGSRAR